MESDHLLYDPLPYDVVLFDAPTYATAERLAALLEPEWTSWIEPRRLGWTVGTELRADAHDLAPLLERALKVVTELELDDVRIELDGRSYSLSPRPAASPVRRSAVT